MGANTSLFARIDASRADRRVSAQQNNLPDGGRTGAGMPPVPSSFSAQAEPVVCVPAKRSPVTGVTRRPEQPRWQRDALRGPDRPRRYKEWILGMFSDRAQHPAHPGLIQENGQNMGRGHHRKRPSIRHSSLTRYLCMTQVFLPIRHETMIRHRNI